MSFHFISFPTTQKQVREIIFSRVNNDYSKLYSAQLTQCDFWDDMAKNNHVIQFEYDITFKLHRPEAFINDINDFLGLKNS